MLNLLHVLFIFEHLGSPLQITLMLKTTETTDGRNSPPESKENTATWKWTNPRYNLRPILSVWCERRREFQRVRGVVSLLKALGMGTVSSRTNPASEQQRNCRRLCRMRGRALKEGAWKAPQCDSQLPQEQVKCTKDTGAGASKQFLIRALLKRGKSD